jgi:hypothetical protein
VTVLVLFKRFSILLAVILIVSIAAWLLFGSTIFFQSNVAFFFKHVFRLDEVWNIGLLQRISSPNPAHGTVDNIRSLYTIAVLLLGAAGAVLGLLSRDDRKQHFTILAIAAVIVMASLVMGFSYMHEIIDRTYLFGIPIIAYLAARLLSNKVTRVILCLFLMGAPALYIIAHYGNQYSDWAPQSNLEALGFFNTNTADTGTLTGNYLSWGDILGSDTLAPLYASPPINLIISANFIEDPEKYTGVLYEQLQLSDNKVTVKGADFAPFPRYVAFSQRDKGFYYWTWNKLPFLNQIEQSVDAASNSNLVYSSPGMKLYVSEK